MFGLETFADRCGGGLPNSGFGTAAIRWEVSMDRMTRVTLMLIAAGLWANAVVMVIQPVRAAPPSEEAVQLSRIATAFDMLLLDGTDCKNEKICAGHFGQFLPKPR
jgi:hypothetical protein